MNRLRLVPLVLIACMTLSCKSEIDVGPGLRDQPAPEVCEVCPDLSSQGLCTELGVALCKALDGPDCGTDGGWTVNGCVEALVGFCARPEGSEFDTSKTRYFYETCLPTIKEDTCTQSGAGGSILPEVCLELWATPEPEEEEDPSVESI